MAAAKETETCTSSALASQVRLVPPASRGACFLRAVEGAGQMPLSLDMELELLTELRPLIVLVPLPAEVVLEGNPELRKATGRASNRQMQPRQQWDDWVTRVRSHSC